MWERGGLLYLHTVKPLHLLHSKVFKITFAKNVFECFFWCEGLETKKKLRLGKKCAKLFLMLLSGKKSGEQFILRSEIKSYFGQPAYQTRQDKSHDPEFLENFWQFLMKATL
jgi:hypothetical protein